MADKPKIIGGLKTAIEPAAQLERAKHSKEAMAAAGRILDLSLRFFEKKGYPLNLTPKQRKSDIDTMAAIIDEEHAELRKERDSLIRTLAEVTNKVIEINLAKGDE